METHSPPSAHGRTAVAPVAIPLTGATTVNGYCTSKATTERAEIWQPSSGAAPHLRRQSSFSMPAQGFLLACLSTRTGPAHPMRLAKVALAGVPNAPSLAKTLPVAKPTIERGGSEMVSFVV